MGILPEKIDAAAIRLSDGVVVAVARPGRHHDVIRKVKEQNLNLRQAVQGFLIDLNRFVDREEAFKIASSAGQIIRNKPKAITWLYSEDLW